MERMKTLYATRCNGIYMLCFIQVHIRTDRSSMKTLKISNISIIISYGMHAYRVMHSK
jgi:hypothetical protein